DCSRARTRFACASAPFFVEIDPSMTFRLPPRTAALAVLGAALTAGFAAPALGAPPFPPPTPHALSGGDLKGTSVDALGRVRAGFTLGTIALGEASAVWSALPLPDGTVLLGTGNQGRVLRIANGQASVYAETEQMAVTSLVTGFGHATF